MKTLLVYYSADGGTAKAARALAAALGVEATKLEPAKPYPRLRLLRYARCAIEGIFGQSRPYLPLGVDPADYDRIVVGTPTWMGRMAGPVRRFMADVDFAGKRVGFFTVCMHMAQDCIVEAELMAGGATVLARRVYTHHDLADKHPSLAEVGRDFAARIEFA